MAFTPEDGSGLDTANAYADVSYVDSYHADRGHASWAGLDTAIKQTCIVRATDYIDKRFGRKFRGQRRRREQELEWPRYNAFDDDGFLLADVDTVPRQLKKACAEYALRAAVYSELAPDPLLVVPLQDFTGDDLPEPADELPATAIREKSEKVDVVEESVAYQSPTQRYASGGRPPTSSLVATGDIPTYPAADLLLEELLTMGQRKLVRG